MSLIPPFEIGLWNAWILAVLALPFISDLIPFLINKKAMQKFHVTPSYSNTEKILDLMARYAIGISTLVYSIFLPLKLGTIWFYVGVSIFWLAVVFYTMATLSFATTPLDSPVTKGIYRVSRHPAYLGLFLMDIGIGIACVSWIFLLLAIVYIILENLLLPTEERWCLEKYGDAYREYMDRTPRWIGIPKSGKK